MKSEIALGVHSNKKAKPGPYRPLQHTGKTEIWCEREWNKSRTSTKVSDEPWNPCGRHTEAGRASPGLSCIRKTREKRPGQGERRAQGRRLRRRQLVGTARPPRETAAAVCVLEPAYSPGSGSGFCGAGSSGISTPPARRRATASRSGARDSDETAVHMF